MSSRGGLPAPKLAPACRAARQLGARAIVVLTAVGAACSSPSAPAPPLSFARNPCLPADTVQLAVATPLLVDCSNGGTTVTFAGGGASYLIVPEFATDSAPFQYVGYNVATGTLTGAPPTAGERVTRLASNLTAQNASGSLPPLRLMTAQRSAEHFLRARGRELARSGAVRTALGMVRTSSPAPTAPPDTLRNFQVVSSFTVSTWATVTGRLVYAGSNVLLYMDTLAPSGGFSPTQLQNFGVYFDSTLYPIDTTAFGLPSDVDTNGHVIMLMSKVVNADTPTAICNTQGYVAGFFNEEDFNGPSDPHSNQGEIFYSIVPDPNGTVSCAHSVTDMGNVVPAVFLHELQHLISFSQHVVVGGGQPGASWLDEGMSIAAEELGSLYYEQKCPPPSCRTNPQQLFPDSAEGFIQEFLLDSYLYGLLPDTESITLQSDANPGSGWRGGAWLLVRWLVDHGGTGIYRTLETGPADGVANIEAATGQPFPALFADFGLALYTDSFPGLARTTAPLADRFTTRNLRELWGRLFAIAGPSSQIPLAMPVQLFAVTGDTSTFILYPGTVTYFRFDTPSNSTTASIRFAAPRGLSFPAALVPQIAVFRLPPGQ